VAEEVAEKPEGEAGEEGAAEEVAPVEEVKVRPGCCAAGKGGSAAGIAQQQRVQHAKAAGSITSSAQEGCLAG
jgi:hypothetical protein